MKTPCKRLDGLFSRPCFTYVDARGQFHKPFLLPQADPEFYESCLKNFNIPELVNGPVVPSEDALAETINHPARRLAPRPASSLTEPAQPADVSKPSNPASFSQ